MATDSAEAFDGAEDGAVEGTEERDALSGSDSDSIIDEFAEDGEEEDAGPVLSADDLGEMANAKIQLKVNGKDETLDLPEVIRLAQLGKGAYGKFEDAAKARKEAETIRGQVQTFSANLLDDPITQYERLWTQAGRRGDPIEHLANRFMEVIKYEDLPPDQRRAQDLDRREQRLRQYEEERQRAAQEQQVEQESQALQQHFMDAIGPALEAEGISEAQQGWAIQQAAALLSELDVDIRQAPYDVLARRVREQLERLTGQPVRRRSKAAIREQRRRSGPAATAKKPEAGSGRQREQKGPRVYSSDADFFALIGGTGSDVIG
jgi:hypothetical protein